MKNDLRGLFSPQFRSIYGSEFSNRSDSKAAENCMKSVFFQSSISGVIAVKRGRKQVADKKKKRVKSLGFRQGIARYQGRFLSANRQDFARQTAAFTPLKSGSGLVFFSSWGWTLVSIFTPLSQMIPGNNSEIISTKNQVNSAGVTHLFGGNMQVQRKQKIAK